MKICPESHKHGRTTTCYHDHGCKCDDCRDSLAARARARTRAKAYGTYEPQKLDPIGLIRRYQGLQVLGWTATIIAAEAGLTHQRRLMAILRQKYITPETHDRFDAAYRRLMLRGRGPSEVTTARALAKGWVSPYAWDDDLDDPNATPADVTATGDLVDEVRIWNAVNGPPRRHRLTSTERTEAIRLLHGKRWTAERIAEQIGCTPRTVERVRARLGLVTVPFTELIKRGEAA